MSWDSVFTLPQIIGYIALAITLGSYQIMSQKGMYGGRMIADGFWGIHYFLLGGFSAVFTVCVGIVRTSIIVFWKPELKNYAIPISIVAVFIFCFYLPEESLFKYMPFLSCVIHSVAQYYHDSFLKSRSIMLLAPITWFLYGIYVVSYGGMMVSIFIFISHSAGMLRYILKKKKGLIND